MTEPAVESAVSESADHVYLTLADEDENQVLELVRVDGPNYFIRHGGAWMDVDPDADNARVWGQIVDVTIEAADEYDRAEAEDQSYIARDRFEDFEIPDEDAA